MLMKLKKCSNNKSYPRDKRYRDGGISFDLCHTFLPRLALM